MRKANESVAKRKESDGWKAILVRAAVITAMTMSASSARCWGAGTWGGSLAVTNDYLVRGISRSDDHAALQLDFDYLNTSGFLAGVFVSNTQLEPGAPRDAEVSGFLGFAWTTTNDWSGKILASRYSYPWNHAGSQYNYDELTVEATYREWVEVSLSFSPDTPRYSYGRGMINAADESLEVNLQHSIWRKLSAIAGLGYSHFDGSVPKAYTYGSIGAAYDLAPVLVSLSYVDASAAAKSLFYSAAVGGRWTGAVIWRF